MDLKRVLEQVVTRYSAILGKNLVGIYLHGSIAFGCFDWERSDIDYLVVVDAPLDMDTKLALMQATRQIDKTAAAKGLEMSVVLKKHCVDFAYPTPFELHYSNTHAAWYENDPADYCEKMCGEDADLAAHFTVVKAVGKTLCGQPIEAVFGEVPKANYLDSIRRDAADARAGIMDEPVYFTLNLCRILAFVREGLVLSKAQGGAWGLKNLDTAFHDIIAQAVAEYTQRVPMAIAPEQTAGFADYMLRQIM